MNQSDKIVIHKLKKIAIISLFFMTIEIVGGILSHSVAILADAFHLLSDVLAYSISLYAVLLSKKLAPKYLSAFGYEKAQPLGALVNVTIIWAVTIGLVIEATNRIIDKEIVTEPLYMLLTSIFGLGCNLFIMRTLHSDQTVPCAHSHGDGGHGHSHGKKPKKQHKHQEGEHKHDHHDHKGHDHHGHDHHDHEHNHQGHDHHDHDHDQSSCKQYKQYKQYIEAICSCESPEGLDIPNYQQDNSTKAVKNELVEERPLQSPLQDIISRSKGYCALHYIDKNNDDNQGPIKKKKFENINMQAAYIHIISDIILSIGVIISASIIFFVAGDATEWTAWQLADPFCTYFFSVVALYSTIAIMRESILILMDGCESNQLINQTDYFVKILRQQHRAVEIDDAKIWSSNRGKHYLTIKIRARTQKISETTENSEEEQSLNAQQQMTIVYRKLKAFMIQKKFIGFIDSRR